MVHPVVVGSLAVMVSTGAGFLLAPKASAYIEAEAGDWCEGGASASAHAHAKARRAHAESGARARAAQWACDHEWWDDDEREDEDDRDEEECEEHGRRHRRHAEAELSADVALRVA